MLVRRKIKSAKLGKFISKRWRLPMSQELLPPRFYGTPIGKDVSESRSNPQAEKVLLGKRKTLQAIQVPK